MLSESESDEEEIPEEVTTRPESHSILHKAVSSLPSYSRDGSLDSNASFASLDRYADGDLNRCSQLNLRMSKVLSRTDSPNISRKENLTNIEKEKLQLFVFLARCIAKPYTQRQIEDWTELQSKKLSMSEFQEMQKNLKKYLQSGIDSVFGQHFHNSMQYFYEHCLQSVHIEHRVVAGAICRSDLSQIYLQRARHDIAIDMGIDFENINEAMQRDAYMTEQLWSKTFELSIGKVLNENDLRVIELYSPELQFDYFRKIFSIHKHYFQLLFNSAKLDEEDEQVAALKRDLNRQKECIESKKALDDFIDLSKGSRYLAKRRQNIMHHLQQQRTSSPQEDEGLAGSGFKKMIGLMKSHQIMSVDDGGASVINRQFFEEQSYHISVVIHNATGLKFLADKKVFVLMELNGAEKKFQTEKKPSSNPNFDINCEWDVNFPCTALRLAAAIDHSQPFHLTDEKEIAKLTIPLHCTYNIHKKYFQMNPITGSFRFDSGGMDPTGDIKICISVRYTATSKVKTAGSLHCYGKKHMTTFKKRFVVLTNISDFTNALCIFKEAEFVPSYLFQLNDYTVDTAEKADMKAHSDKADFPFKLIRLGDEIYFAAKNAADLRHWISKLYMATGQSYKPNILNREQSTEVHFDHTSESVNETDAEKNAAKHGFDSMVNADPYEFDQKKLYNTLLKSIFEYKRNQEYIFLGKLAMGEKMLLEDYAIRYNVRYCYTQLCLLNLLLSYALNGHTVDTRIINSLYHHILKCARNSGDDEASTMTKSEEVFFNEVKEQLINYLDIAISNFKKKFPCGFPPLNFLNVIKMFEQIHTTSSASRFETSLKKAALNNYIDLSSLYKIKELSNDLLSFDDSLPVYLSFTTQCISDTDELRCYYSEEISHHKSMFIKYHHYYWLLYSTELFAYLDQRPDYSFSCLKLFQLINEFCLSHESIQLVDFHEKVIQRFEPIVLSYMDYKKDLMLASANINLSNEDYEPITDKFDGSLTKTGVTFLEEFQLTKTFVELLKWPRKELNNQIKGLLKEMKKLVLETIFRRYIQEYESELRRSSVTFDFIIPKKCCVVINSTTYVERNLEMSNVAALIIKDFIEKQEKMIADKYTMAILMVLKKLSYYDHGSYTSKFATWLKPKTDLASDYFTFLSNNVRECRHEIKHTERRQSLFKAIWGETCLKLNVWLTERKEVPLHLYQLHVLSDITETCRDLLATDISKTEAENENFKEVKLRLDCEEAVNALKEN